MATDINSKLFSEALEAGIKARELILKFSTLLIEQDEFIAGLGAIKAQEKIFAGWDMFKENKDLYPCLEIYQIIASLHADLDQQFTFYGCESLREDVKQIDIAIDILKRALGMEIVSKEKYFRIIKKQFNGGI